MNLILEKMSFSQLFGMSEPKRVVRSIGVTGPPLKLDSYGDAIYYQYNFKSKPSTTGLRWHGYIKFLNPGKDKPLSQCDCIVDCPCHDYRYTWSWANKQKGAGVVGPNSLNQAINRAPRIKNPTGRPGLCKHLLALKQWIQGVMANFPNGDRTSSDEVVAKLTKWAKNRWINMPAEKAKAKARDAQAAQTRALQRAGRMPAVPTDDAPEEPETGQDQPSVESLAVDMKRTTMKGSKLELPDLTDSLKVLGEMADEMETQPSAAQGEKGEALQLLRDISAGVRDLNLTIRELNADNGEEPIEPVGDEDEEPEAPEEEPDVIEEPPHVPDHHLNH